MYGVATITRLFQIIAEYNHFYLQNIITFIGSFAEDIYHFKEPINRCHPIAHSFSTDCAAEDLMKYGTVCCSVLQFVAVCCSVLQHSFSTY